MAVLTASMTLVQDAKQGDQVAFMSLLEPLLEPGYRLACGMLHDHQAAEDSAGSRSQGLAQAWPAARGPATDFDAVPGVALPLYRTDDGGLTWVPIQTNVVWRSRDARVGPIDILDFVDQNNSFAVRENYMANGYTQWLKTTGGGRTWTVVVEAPRTP